MEMTTCFEMIELQTQGNLDMLDLTGQVAALVVKSGISTGAVTVFVPGSTAALTTIEYEDGVLEDLRRTITRLAPESEPYAHNRRWGDDNGHSHVRAALFGPDLHIPVNEGQMVLGAWQQILLIDFDNRPRQRQIAVSVVGNQG